MPGIMRTTLRRSVLAAGGTLLAGTLARKWLPAAAAQDAHPPVQPFSVLKSHPPSILPRIAFTDADGGTSGLDRFAGHGIVLNLWATWCIPCVAEMPSLDGLARVLAPAGILVLPVSLDHDGAARVAPFYKAHGITSLPVLLDPHSAILAALGLEGIPMTLLIDRQGREVARVQGSVDWADPKAAVTVRQMLA